MERGEGSRPRRNENLSWIRGTVKVLILPVSAFLLSSYLWCGLFGWYPLWHCPTKGNDVETLVQLFDMMENNDFGEIENLPAIIEAAIHRIEDDLDTFRSSGESEGHWRENVTRMAYEVLDQYREVNENVYKFVHHGRDLMQDMVDHELDEIQRAFNERKFDNIFELLGDISDHLREAEKPLTTVKAKLKTARSATDELFRVIMLKCSETVTSASDVKPGWSAIVNTTLYSLGIGTGTVSALMDEDVDSLSRVISHMDEAERQNLVQRLSSEAKGLSAVGGKVRIVTNTLNQCINEVIRLEVAVGIARVSTEKMTANQSVDADLFASRLRRAKRNYQKLLDQYNRVIERIESASKKSK